MKPAILASLAATFFIVGCAPTDDEIVGVDKTSVAFKGEPDKRFVGTWKSTSIDSTYKLAENGTYALHSRVKMPGGPGMINADSKGEWRLDGDKLLFKDAQGNVVPYDYTLVGDTLTFTSTGKMKNKTELKLQADEKGAGVPKNGQSEPKG